MSLPQKTLADALGRHESFVTRYKAKGMPTGSVEAAQEWVRKNVRPRIKPSAATDSGGRVPDTAPHGKSDDAGSDDNTYWISRARREQAEAELAELKLAEQRGELLRIADVRSAYAKRAAGLREALLQIPMRLAAVLAAENDQARVHDRLQSELHAVLEQMVAT